MTTTNTNRPIVKTIDPDLYAQHTFHMKRATNYTYNYAALDDYILQNWDTTTAKQIANDRNEYLNRVQWRIQVLQERGHIKTKGSKKQKLTQMKRSLTIKLQKVQEKLEKCG
jgi:hypothetical protein